MTRLQPLNFKKWIESHRHLLKPPVGNQQVWEDREFMVTVVGGPNERRDYHINEGEEFFYQLEGSMVLRVLQNGKPEDIVIDEGDIFLLPGRVPHSPQRRVGTVGLVIERRRLAHERDGLVWICDACHTPLYEEFFHLKSLVADLVPVIQRYRAQPEHGHCKACGHVNEV